MPEMYEKIGDVLASARQERGKSIAEASDATRIMTKHLEAIEAGDASRLPSESYFMLFARSYAQYLGVDLRVFDEIRDAATPPEVTEAPQAVEKARPRQERISSEKHGLGIGRLVIAIIALLIVAVGGYFAYLKWFSPLSTQAGFNESISAVSDSPVDSLFGVADSSENFPVYQPPPNLVLLIAAMKNCRITVASDGDTVLNREMIAGETNQLDARYRLILTLATPGAMELTLNGSRLAPILQPGPQTFEINQANYRKYLAPVVDSTALDSAKRVAGGGRG